MVVGGVGGGDGNASFGTTKAEGKGWTKAEGKG